MRFNFDDVPPLYSQEGKRHDAIVYAHLFNAGSDWWITEYDPEEKVAFGFVCLNGWEDCAELGYISIPEIEELNQSLSMRRFGGIALTVEQDLHWTPNPLKDIELYRRVMGVPNPSPAEVASQARDVAGKGGKANGENDRHIIR